MLGRLVRCSTLAELVRSVMFALSVGAQEAGDECANAKSFNRASYKTFSVRHQDIKCISVILRVL